MSTDAKTKASEAPPRFLYRYLDHFGLNAIYELALKITPPSEFNDPFEFTPRLSKDKSEQIILQQRISKITEGLRVSATDAQRAEIERRMRLDVPSEFRDAASRQFAVLCLSAKPDIATQWAHYSDKHTGLVLELDMNAEAFQGLLRSPLGSERLLFPVHYLCAQKKSEQKLNAALQDMLAGREEALLEVLLGCAKEKSPEWHLEKEHRMVISLKKTEPGLNDGVESRLINGQLLYFLKISPEAITRVILGARATAEFEHEVRKAANALWGHNRMVIKAKLDFEKLEVNIPG